MCRESVNNCDISDYCDGTAASCPSDQWRTKGHSIKCARDIFLCNIRPDEVSSDRRLAGANMGVGGEPLIWNCANAECPDWDFLCPMGTDFRRHGISNFISFTCDRDSGEWVFDAKVERDTDTRERFDAVTSAHCNGGD